MGGLDFIQDLALLMLAAAAVGCFCRRLALPVIIGYLGAGVLLSPNTHSFGWFADVDRIHALAHVGLVFLVFKIGHELTLQRLKRMSLPLILGTLLTALFVMVACRWFGALLGWPSEYGIVLGALLMISSSTVIGRTLHEAKQTHTTFGQNAINVTTLDNLLAVIMLVALGSLLQNGASSATEFAGTIFRLKAVVVALIVGSLLLIPRLLLKVPRASAEIISLFITGLLLGMALLSGKAGISAAVGAFLLGLIVGTTSRIQHVGRVMGALNDVFTPVFFIAMGMLFDIQILFKEWYMVLGVILLMFVLRTIAATGGLLMVGRSSREATRAAFCLLPIGEFSFIIALAAVQDGIVPESFFSIAVSAGLAGAAAVPILTRHSGQICSWIETKQPKFLAEFIGFYQEWIENLKGRQTSTFLWRLIAPRFVQVGILVLFVSGLLVFASPLYLWTQKWLGAEKTLSQFLPIVFWSLFMAIIAAPLVAIWRQVEALSMICAEATIKRSSKLPLLRPVFEKLLRTVAITGIVMLFATLVPYHVLSWQGLLLLLAGAIIIASVYWRRLIRLHSRFEVELRTQLSESPFAIGKKELPDKKGDSANWKISLNELIVTENSQACGVKIGDLQLRAQFGCIIVRIQRQGIIISNPGPDVDLYPDDKLLLLGNEKNHQAAEQWLNRSKKDSERPVESLEELSLDNLVVPPSSRHIGRTLGELGIRSQFGVQIVGIARNSTSLLTPGPNDSLASGDQLLLLGTPEQVSDMALWLSN